MAQTDPPKVTCDAADCRKQLGESNDHLHVVANHIIAGKDLSDAPPTSIFSGDYDFCSWEHAAAHFKVLSGEAAAAREAKLSGEAAAPSE